MENYRKPNNKVNIIITLNNSNKTKQYSIIIK